MRRRSWLVLCSLYLIPACTQTEGQCWHEDQAAGNIGAGGGAPIVTGVGGFGDVAPGPQDVGDPMPPDCETVPGTECDQKCLTDYEAASEKCAGILDDAQRTVCQQSAYVAYKTCRTGCQQALNKCKDLCDKVYNKCMDRCKDDKCRKECFDDYVECLRDCDR